MNVKKIKQLTLDYFSSELGKLKNEMKEGGMDALLPLREYIEIYNQMKENRLEHLPEYISSFSELCDVFKYKINAFRAFLHRFDEKRLENFLSDPGGMLEFMKWIPWTKPLAIQLSSLKFLEAIIEYLNREKTILPKCEIVDYERQENLSIPIKPNQDMFSEEEKLVHELLAKKFKTWNERESTNQTVQSLLDEIHSALALSRMRGFIILLHLIQDGLLTVKERHDSKDDGADDERIIHLV